MIMRRARACAALAALALGGCGGEGAGALRAHWASADTILGAGDLTLPLKATWCGSRGRLTLLAVTGDTGVGVLVRTVRFEPGLFKVWDTTAARSPGAALAFRMMRGGSLYTLSGDSGAVAITSTREGRVSGRFVAWFSREERGPVVVTGRFKAKAVPDSVRCESSPAPPQPPASADSGVS